MKKSLILHINLLTLDVIKGFIDWPTRVDLSHPVYVGDHERYSQQECSLSVSRQDFLRYFGKSYPGNFAVFVHTDYRESKRFDVTIGKLRLCDYEFDSYTCNKEFMVRNKEDYEILSKGDLLRCFEQNYLQLISYGMVINRNTRLHSTL
jgi:hypothetical protein